MTRFVVGPDIGVRLAHERAEVADEHVLLAPTLWRSEVLARLFRAARAGELTRAEAREHLAHLRALRVRLLGDRVLQQVAWEIADDLGWDDTFHAEYLALTRLQADAFVTLDEGLAERVGDVVRIATYDELTATAD